MRSIYKYPLTYLAETYLKFMNSPFKILDEKNAVYVCSWTPEPKFYEKCNL